MSSVEIIKQQLHYLLVKTQGNPDDADLVLLRKAAKDLSYDSRGFNRLLQEVHGSINWVKLREEADGEDVISGPPLIIFETKVRSLNKLGEVLHLNEDKAKKYLTDSILLKENVNYLSQNNVDKTLHVIELYKSESDANKRYLRIIYHLNPRLPYRIGNIVASDLKALFSKGFEAYDNYKLINNEFTRDRLQVWLQETDKESAALLPEMRSDSDFLQFVYKVHHKYPFYLGDRLFTTPLDLVNKAKGELSLWNSIADNINNGYLSIWLNNIDPAIWKRYTGKIEPIIKSTYHNEKEKKLASVQMLLQTVDSTIPIPKIISETKSIELTSVEGTGLINEVIKLKLQSPGYLKAKITLSDTIPGWSIDKKNVEFHDLSMKNYQKIILEIDPLPLVKDKLYKASLIVESVYEAIEISIQVSIVFPKKAFITYLVKYAIGGAIFFGISRFLLGKAIENGGWLNDYGQNGLPNNYFTFIAAFFAITLVMIGSYFLIKKVEKI